METALRLLGTLLIIDLALAFLLVGLVALVGQRGQRRVPLRVLLGAFVYLGICTGLIYGSLWMLLRMGRI